MCTAQAITEVQIISTWPLLTMLILTTWMCFPVALLYVYNFSIVDKAFRAKAQ